MTHKEFDTILKSILNNIETTLSTKSNDYSTTHDKLYNFYLQARMQEVSPFESLQGNWAKHLASIRMGLDELKEGSRRRSLDWWYEKTIDSINYQILLLAMIQDTSFYKDEQK